MKQISGNCILSFALWGEEPPDHIITSIEIIDESYIVTGDKLGHMVIWNVNSENKINPMWYLFGHSGSICTLSKSMISLSNDRYVVSVTINREMGLWNCVDGRCVRLERHLLVDHKVVKGYQMSNNKSGLLVCCGHYTGIQVLDSITLAPILSLQSRAHPDWIQSVCVFEHRHAGMHVVLGLSISGAITMWTIESLEVPQESKVVYETESKMLMLTCPILISICPNKPRLVMVLASTTMQIYDAATWTLLTEYHSETSCFFSGWFLNSKTVMLLPKNGHGRLYKVSINSEDGLKHVNELNTICGLDTSGSDVSCQAVVVNDSRLLVAAGHGMGTIFWWNLDTDTLKTPSSDSVGATEVAVLHDKWSELNMSSLTRPFRNEYSISCCHCESSTNTLMMGTTSGDILIMDLLQSLAVALFYDTSCRIVYHVLSGHQKAVLALQYAKTDSVKQWLWSGGEDFSVRLWSLDSRTCVSVFHCHSGPVTSFLTGPPLGLTKGKHDGHIIAPKKAAIEAAEQEVLRPINFSTWFGHRLYVSLDQDNGVAFLSLEAKKVVLHVSLFSPIQMICWRRDQISVVLQCIDGSVTIWDLCAGHLERQEVGQISEDIVDTSTDHMKLSNHPPLLLRISHIKDRIKHAALPPLQLHPINVGKGAAAQILFCDTESLLVDIHSHLSTQKSCTESLLQAQFLLSLINQWGSDPCLDTTLESTIGLLRPTRQLCYGHMNVKYKTLSFPLQRCDDPVGRSLALLSGVSLCHAINNLPESQQTAWPRLSRFLDNKTSQLSRSVSIDNHTEVRQVCCLFATSMATANLPQLLGSCTADTFDMAKIPIIIQTFLQKYHDRCLEIREASRTLLHAAMDCLSSEQRHELVQFWAFHGRVVSKSDTSKFDLDPHRNDDDSKGRKSISSISEAPSICDWRYWNHIFVVGTPPEVEQLQAIALSFLGIVGCRYGSPDLQLSPASNVISVSVMRSRPLDKAITGFGLDDYRLARATCGYLMSLLTKNAPSATGEHKTNSHWSNTRCLAITLLGQGFPVWEPYLEVSTLFNKLLEIVAPAEKILVGWRQGQLLTDEMDAVRSARTALLVIALARPKVFATALSIEVLRHQTQSTSSPGSAGGTQTAVPTNGSVGSRVGPTVAGTPHQPPLIAARHEVIEVIRVLCERKTREMHEVLPEIMDILLACLSKLDLRQYDFQQLFPPILLFRIASSHTASGKVCVGTRTGHVAFYDVKVGKYNTSPGHSGPVTSVSFSPDGKQMASYSMPDNSVCIWQLFSSGLFGMGSSHQVKLVSRLNVPPVAVSHTVTAEDSSLLLWLEWSENKSIHLVTSAGLINKIKL